MSEYKAPSATRIGHIHLKVSSIQRSLEFYSGLLGFELITMYGDQAAFISAGGYHHHIGLNTWYSKDAPPAQKEGVAYITRRFFIQREKNSPEFMRVFVKKDIHLQVHPTTVYPKRFI